MATWSKAFYFLIVLTQKQKQFWKWHAKGTKNPRVSNVLCEGWVILSQSNLHPPACENDKDNS